MLDMLLYPPVAFVIFLLFGGIMLKLSSLLAYKADITAEGTTKAYACGEDVVHQKIKPNYISFFSFAFFFTVMHVVALMLATIPSHMISIPPITLVYMLSAFLGVFILFKR